MKYDPLEYRHLIDRRHDISLLLLELRKLSKQARQWTQGGAHARAYAWNRLVGVGFALWRAIPLLDDWEQTQPLRNDEIETVTGENLLDELIQHNRITYEQERDKARYWAAGFYLNDAEDRIVSVFAIDLHGEAGIDGLCRAAKVVENVKTRHDPTDRGRPARCDDAREALLELTDFIGRLRP